MKTKLLGLALFLLTGTAWGQAIIDPGTMIMTRAFGWNAEHISFEEQRQLRREMDSLRVVDQKAHQELEAALDSMLFELGEIQAHASRDLITAYTRANAEPKIEEPQVPDVLDVVMEDEVQAPVAEDVMLASTESVPTLSAPLNITVFPNPTRTNATVRFTLEESAKATITLHAMDGKPPEPKRKI